MSETFQERLKRIKKDLSTSEANSSSNTTAPSTSGTQDNTGESSERNETYAERIARIRKSKNYNNIDNNFISSFMQDVSSYQKEVQEKYSGLTWQSAASESALNSLIPTNTDLANRANMIQRYLDDNRGYIDGASYNELQRYLNSFYTFRSSAMIQFREASNYYQQWDSEESYNSYMNSPERKWAEAYSGKSYSEIKDIMSHMDSSSAEYEWLRDYSRSVMTVADYDEALKEANKRKTKLETNSELVLPAGQDVVVGRELDSVNAEIESLKAGKWRLEKEEKYQNLSSNPDFKELSTDVKDKKTATFGVQLGDSWLGTGDPVYDFINNIEGVQDEAMHNPDPESRPVATMYKYAYMNDSEVATYNYLYNAEGEDAAKEYLEYLSYELDERRLQQAAQDVAVFADEHPVVSSVLSIPTNLISGIGIVDAAFQKTYNDIYEGITGEYAGPVNFNSWAMNPSVMTSSIRGTVAQNIADSTGVINLDEEDHPILSKLLNGKSLGDVYQLGMSMADSSVNTVTAAVTGGTGNFGLALLGGSAATSGMLDAVSRGATDEQAITMGLYNGAFEMLFEKVSLDNLLKGDTRSLVKGILQQGFVEGTEEVSTSFCNNVADILVMAGKSDYQHSIAAYMALGMSEEDATKQALLDMAIEMGWDFVGGAISGGIMGGGGTVVNTVQQNFQAKNMYGENVGDLINETLEINPNNELAQKMQARQDAGKTVSGSQIYNLVQQNEEAIQNLDKDSIYDATLQRLRTLGETENVRAVSVALTKQVMGERLTAEDRRVLSNSKYGQRVANELNPENIKSGEYSTAWSQQINTNRINPEEYSSYIQAVQEAQAEPAAQTETANINADTRQASQEAQEQPQTTKAEEIVSQKPKVDSEAKYEAAPAVESDTQEEAPEAETEGSVTLEDASKKYGAQAGAMIHTYKAGQDVRKYDAAYQMAYNMGKSGVNLSYVMSSEVTSYLSETQRELAYSAGKAAADTTASEKEAANAQKANGNTGWKKGSVKGEGVTISDLKETFNDTQNTAYKLLSTYAEATGVNIVLFKSEVGEDGRFTGAQGKYKQSEPGTIYIDVNAGLARGKDVTDLAKYAMMRTFAHEFTHFIENWNPVQYNEFRKVVFDTLTESGENVHDLIEQKQEQSPGMDYDAASREIVAEAMTDILPDANFVKKLAENHKNIFTKLLEKLKEFADKLRSYYNSIGHNRSREANALKEQVGEAVHYVDNIVKLFDNVSVQAVENYQKTVAVEEATVVEQVEEVAPVVEHTTETEVQEPVSITDELGFTITDNVEHGSLEISFEDKPSEKVRDVLKANKFRWHKTKKVWYGYGNRADITDALRAAYEVEETTEEEPAVTVEETPAQVEFEKKFREATQAERDEVVQAIDENMGKISHMYPTEIRGEQTVENIEEVTSNAKESTNGTDNAAVHEPVRGSEGTPQLLEGVESETVRRSDEGRESVQSGSDQGTENAGRDRQSDAAGTVSERGERDRVGGDLQQLSGVTEESQEAQKPDTDAVKLHEVVVDLTAQRSTENPKGSNFVIGDSLDLPNGAKSRTRANIEAIKLVKQIAAEGRIATAAEQVILSKYVGWGGLADAFGKPVSNHTTRKIDYEPVEGLEAEFEELKQVLTEEEYKAARESTKNAHYTSIEVIKAMYDGLKQFGFTGGRMLEPSSGVGNFVGAMPADMTATVKSWTMVELDNITGMLAKYLYPNADVRIQGFEEANIPDGYMDVAIGNVPFGNYVIHDKHYPKTVTSAIHNYFFAKALDKVRPGGICMFITSAYTMNGKDNAVRQYIMQRADLLGAIRLPNTAFAGNAGTSVVTDILILKKREARTEYAGEAFAESNWERVSNTGWEGAYVNEYFTQHPEMVLGKAKLARGLYSANELTYDPYTDRGPLGDQIREALKNIQGKMDYPTQLSPERENFRQANAKKKSQKLKVKDGVIQAEDQDGNISKVEVDKDTAARITGMVAIREAHTALCDALQQGVNKKTINALRKTLNKAYDAFIEKYGYLNSAKNKKAINAFSDRYAILSLENYSLAENPSGKGKKVEVVSKTDIFTKDTISANRTAASAENVEEGLTISLNTAGRVDVPMIARLTGQKAENVTRQMIDQRLVFKDREGNLIPAVQYLSGNVRAKLREMEGLVGIDSDYKNNVEALREVVPPTVQHTDIYVNPGANWVPVSVYEDFVGHILNRHNHESWRTGKKDFSVEYVPETNEYKVTINDSYAKQSAQNTQVWGEGGKTFSLIFENMLNGRRTNVYRTDAEGNRVLDKARTEAVAEKVEKLNEEFRKWLWDDEARRGEMQELYNETYNALVTPKYSGSSLTVNGLNSEYNLRDHQKDAVARIINSGGNTLLAHRVGAGKTMEMAAAAMKLKQLGVIKKPMFVVPNNVVAQWGKEFKDYFPAANILLVGDEDMTPAERMTTINKIKNNDYDAVILAYTKFEKIQMTKAWRQKFYEEQIESIMFAINAEKEATKGKGFSVKQLEAKRKSLESKVKKLTDKAKDEDGAMFEDLGVDSLFVDEAHNFKNLEYSTRMSNVSGLGKADGSQRAFDLYTKVRYLQQLNGGRGIVFATATPVMNSMTEMYIMQKYLQPDTLKQLGIEHFDSWAKMFGEVVNTLEIAPSGSGYRLKQTFSKFKNIKALQQLFRSFTDVLTDIPGLKIPKMKGGKVQIVECEQGEFQKNFMAELAKRAENVKNVDPSEDNMLKITSDGRKISYSQRMFDPSLPYEENGKIYKCCDNVYAVYKESNKTKGTQMIFCDMATPKGKSSKKTSSDTDTGEFASVDMESAQLYDDIKARLIQLGIPENEIAFIHDAKNDKQKADLSEKMNEGTIRVLIGSTGKMGVGLNAQVKAVAIHHLDAPWRPGDIEQRDGRVFRQKNENEEAYKFVYVTKGSFDSRLWDILERKQKFINQVMNGEDVGNEIEDTGEVTLSAAEVKAVASGSPLIMEQVALEKEISKLESLQKAYMSNISRAAQKMQRDRIRIEVLEKGIVDVTEDIQNRKDTYSDNNFSIQIGRQTYTDKKDAGAALIAAAQGKAKEGSYTSIGKFAGFDLRVVKTSEGIKGQVSGAGNYDFKTYPLNPTYGINHLISVVQSFDDSLAAWERELGEVKNDLETQKKLTTEPFEQAEKLKEKRARYAEVMDILNPPVEQKISEEGVQEQSRSYLSEDAEKFRKDIDRWKKDGRPGYGQFILGSTGDVLQGLGAIESDIYMKADKINTILSDHPEMGLEEIKKIPQILENPILILSSKGKGKNRTNSRIVIFGNVKASNRQHVLAILDMRPIEKNNLMIEDMQKVSSAYTKTKNPADFVQTSDVLYVDKNRTAKLFRSIGLQYRPTDLLLNGYIGSIDYSGTNVNISGTPFSDVVGNGTAQYQSREYLEDDRDLAPTFLYQGQPQYQQRTSTLTDREVLEIAANDLKIDGLTAGEIDALQIFKDRLTKLEELQEKRAEQGKLYKEQQFGAKVDREAAAATLNRMHLLDDQIRAANDDVFDVEEKAVLRKVLQKARTVVEKQERQHGKELLNRWRDRRNNAADIKKYRERIRGDVDELSNWILHPSNKDIVKHVPDALKKSVIPFLSSINFMSKQSLKGGNPTVADQEFMKRLEGIQGALIQNQNVEDMYSGYSDLPPNFMDRLQNFIDATKQLVENNNGEFIINKMTSEELKELSQVVRTLKEYIKNFNRFHVNAMFQHVYEAGDNTISELARMDSAGPRVGSASNFVFWQQIRPAYAFERFGAGGKSVYDGLRQGQAQLAFNTKKILEFSEKAYTKKEVKAWEGEIKDIKLSDDSVVKMPVSTIMSFYELSKRPKARGHILGEGIRVATYKHNGRKISDVGHMLTPDDVNTIISALTPRQKEVADNLQKFMQEQGGKWGNYVSMKRFGESRFGESHYFPINSDGRHLSVNAEEHPSAASLYALLNLGFTKETTEGANNRIILYSIFDVFANHMASVAQYNALALPVVDALKWFNYQQKSDLDENGKRSVLGSVRDQMDRVYGVPEENKTGSGRRGYAQSFVINILKAFNGTEAQGTPMDSLGMKALHFYNKAQIAYNFRVVVQQPMAITRAAQILDYRSIIRGLRLSPAAIKKNIAEMQQHSGIAAWKSLGFYDVNISRGLTDLIKHDTSWSDKVTEMGLWGAEKADVMTWAAMWSAAKEEVARKQHISPQDAGFYEAVTKLFEDVIYKTQVVDSVLTKNEFMRDKGFFARSISSFMSEPVTTASMLIDAYDKYHMDMQRGMTRQQAWKNNRRMIVRTAYVYAIGGLILSAVQSVADAWRDDDDYQTFMEKWLEAMGDNALEELIPVNKLPGLSQGWEFLKELSAAGWKFDIYGQMSNFPWTDVAEDFIKGVEIISDLISGEDTSYTWYAGASKLLRALSGLTGVPMAATTREVVNLWNNIAGSMAPSLKIKSYDPGEKNEIKYAFMDGYLTADEAMNELLTQGLVDTENEAYWMVQGWEDGSSSNYDAIYDAVRNGGDFDAAMDELTTHGYTEKDVLSNVKSQIGKWYQGGEISKQQAIDMLTKYLDLDSDEITSQVNKWSSKVVTGIAFGDIKDEFLAGNITKSRAIDMYVRYGGYTREKATDKVEGWIFEQEHGFSYENRVEQFKEGNISAQEMLDIMMTTGGKTKEEAQKSLYGYCREGYEEGYFVRSEAARMMVQYGGLTEAEAESKLRYVDVKSQFPDTYVDDTWVDEFYEEVESSGLSLKVFIDYRNQVKNITGEGKKERRMAVIDSLPISYEQKDALYYAEGWATSRIYEAPWH